MNKLFSVFVFGLLLTMLVPFAMMDAYAATEHIVNGGFETGDFTAWTVIPSGGGGNDFYINDGTHVGLFDPGTLSPQPPISGSFDSVSDQIFADSPAMLSEVFTVPSGITSSTVSWEDRIDNIAGIYQNPGQEVRVEIRDAAGATVLTTLFVTIPGDPLVQGGPNSRSFDITAFMQAHEGDDIRFCVTTHATILPLMYWIDDISLTTETVPVGGTFIPIDTSALLLAGVQSISMWMIPVILAGIGIGVFVIKRRN